MAAGKFEWEWRLTSQVCIAHVEKLSPLLRFFLEVIHSPAFLRNCCWHVSGPGRGETHLFYLAACHLYLTALTSTSSECGQWVSGCQVSAHSNSTHKICEREELDRTKNTDWLLAWCCWHLSCSESFRFALRDLFGVSCFVSRFVLRVVLRQIWLASAYIKIGSKFIGAGRRRFMEAQKSAENWASKLPFSSIVDCNFYIDVAWGTQWWWRNIHNRKKENFFELGGWREGSRGLNCTRQLTK